MKDQHKTGAPAKPRGQQTGFAGNPDQNRQAKKETPELQGLRESENKFFADKSAQQETGDAVTPRSNHPSTPAMNSAQHKGESGGEKVFKRRLARDRKAAR